MPIRLIPKRLSGTSSQPKTETVSAAESQTINDKEVEAEIMTVLAQITGPEGYVSASRVAEKTGLSLSVTIKTLVRLANEKRILYYGPGEDLWAVSLNVRQAYEKGENISQLGQNLVQVQKKSNDEGKCPIVEVRESMSGPVEIRDHPKESLQTDGEDVYCSNCGARWSGMRKHFSLLDKS